MVFSNIDIRQAIVSGHIVCNPFNPKAVSQASLDVTLGHYYFRTEQTGTKSVYNPFSARDVARYFGNYREAIPYGKWCDKAGVALGENMPPDQPVISLAPGERILAHTHEFFGIYPPGAAEIKARSSWGRNGVAVCFDAGWIDPGYVNRLTLEIYNLNKYETIVLPVGERIAQVIFHLTGEVEGTYGLGRDNGFSGKYQQGDVLEELIAKWKPDDMLPKSYLDKRAETKPIDGLNYL